MCKKSVTFLLSTKRGRTMARKKLHDSKGNAIQGLYYDELKNGKHIFARFNLRTAPQWVNLTKEYGIKTISEAKKQRNRLLEQYQSPDSDYIKNKRLVNDLIEEYIGKRPENEKYPNRSQRKIVENRYKAYLKEPFKYVTVEKLSSKHIEKIKTDLNKRQLGKESFNKVKTLIRSALKDTGLNFDKLFIGFEPKIKDPDANKKKYKIDEYFTEHLEDVAQGFYNTYATGLENAKLQKEKDKYAILLYLLLTASRVGETSLLKIKDVELFDRENNIYRVIIPKSINKKLQTREVKVPTIITPFIENRLSTAKENDYLFQTNIENVLPYWFKKSTKQFKLKRTKGLSVHIFRALFRNVALDRDWSSRAVNYIMDRQKASTVDEKYYDAKLTHQQRYNVYKLFSDYEKLCRGELEKQLLDFSALV